MNDLEKKILDTLSIENETLSHSELRERIKQFAAIYTKNNICDCDFDLIMNEFEKIRGIKTFEPDILVDSKEETDWFESQRKYKVESDIEEDYFNRYKEFLKKNRFSEQSIIQIKKNCEEILKNSANPNSTDFSLKRKKKGLVIGDVQSGKTANFMGLINLAIDYGYRFIIVLSGITEYLRQQTQKRVDAGLIGAKADTINSNDIVYVGVGKINNENKYYSVSITSTRQDFLRFVKKHTNFRLSDINKPVVVVSKKNSNVLNALGEWIISDDINLSTKNVLIIDDEADNASVNTKKSTETPSAINSLIRNIYNKVRVATYVGYTATPFANIFIDPYDHKFENADLFPSDFIVQLNSDSNYFGHSKVFNSKRIRLISEKENNYLQLSHKKNSDFEMTESLKTAIKLFVLSNVIRTLRKDKTAHRTMMIHLSVFNHVQSLISEKVTEYLSSLVLTITQSVHFEDEKFFRDSEMHDLYLLYSNDELFSEARKVYSWQSIKELLVFESTKIQVAIFNNTSSRFDYEEFEDEGARLIAIGGYVLSRGLTLEGLSLSYFNRRCSAYDTMLQMCRWFGYRNNYEDLCLVYMTQTNIDNYGAVFDAIEDLRLQFKEMSLRGKKPIDFGLMVKQSPESLETDLIVTARNKTRETKEISVGLNYGGVVADTSKIFKDTKYNSLNLKAIENFVEQIKLNNIKMEKVKVDNRKSKTIRNMYLDVPKKFIASLIKSIKIPIENRKFDIESLAEYINTSNVFESWDVVIAEGFGKDNRFKYKLSGQTLSPVVRETIVNNDDETFFRIGGSNNRLLEPGIFNSGLNENQIHEATGFAEIRYEETGKSKDIIAKDYLRVSNRKPLLVIYPIQLPSEEQFSDYTHVPLIGFGLGFPAKQEPLIVRYRANKIKYEELMKSRMYNDYDEEEEEDD